MSLFDDYKAEHASRLSHCILVAVGATFVIGTTLLNIAFSFAPVTMVEFVRDLMA